MNFHLCKESPCPLEEKEMANRFTFAIQTHYVDMDGIPIYLERHGGNGERWIKRIISWIQWIFFRPKFSNEVLEFSILEQPEWNKVPGDSVFPSKKRGTL